MGYIITVVILALVLGGVWFYFRRVQKEDERLIDEYTAQSSSASEHYGYDQDAYSRKLQELKSHRRTAKWIKLGAIGAFALIFVLLTGFRSYKAIEAGHVGVVYQFGAIQNETLSEGVNWIAPWQSVRTQDIKTQKKTFDNVQAVSKETQDVGAKVTVNLRVDPRDVQNLFRNVGPDWYERLVPNRVQQAFKETTVLYPTVEIAPNREQVKIQTRDKLRASLQPYSIDVADVNIENLTFSEAFTEAIEQKQVATQEAQRQQQLVVAEQAKADQAIAAAKGQAESNRLVAESLRTNPEIVRLRIAEYQRDALLGIAKEGTVQLVPADLLLTKSAP